VLLFGEKKQGKKYLASFSFSDDLLDAIRL